MSASVSSVQILIFSLLCGTHNCNYITDKALATGQYKP